MPAATVDRKGVRNKLIFSEVGVILFQGICNEIEIEVTATEIVNGFWRQDRSGHGFGI